MNCQASDASTGLAIREQFIGSGKKCQGMTLVVPHVQQK
jgi:hypothetical protein